jgi:antitoxin Phd
MTWSAAQAKNQFAEVLRRAAEQGPQTISVRGRETAVVLSKADYEQLNHPDRPKTFKEALMQLNLDGVDLTRDPTPTRDLEF